MEEKKQGEGKQTEEQVNKRRFSFLSTKAYRKVRDIPNSELIKKSPDELIKEYGIAKKPATNLYNHFGAEREKEENISREFSGLQESNNNLRTKLVKKDTLNYWLRTWMVGVGAAAMIFLGTTFHANITKGREIKSLVTQIQTQETTYENRITDLRDTVNDVEAVNKDLDSKYKTAIFNEQELRVRYNQVEIEKERLDTLKEGIEGLLGEYNK